MSPNSKSDPGLRRRRRVVEHGIVGGRLAAALPEHCP